MNAEDGWSFALPEGFVKRSVRLPAYVQQFVGPTEEGNTINIVIESLPGKDSAEAVGKAVAKDPGKDAVLQDSGKYDLPGTDAFSVKVTKSKGILGQRQVYLSHDGVCVIFTLTAPSTSFDNWDQVFRNSLESFRWIQKSKPKPEST